MQWSFHLQLAQRARANKHEKYIYNKGKSRRLHTKAAESRKDWIILEFHDRSRRRGQEFTVLF